MATGYRYGGIFNAAVIPALEDENRKLKEENKRLKIRLNTLLTKEISVLPTIAAVKCPKENEIICMSECRECDYFKSRTSLNTYDGQEISRVYCAYREWVKFDPDKPAEWQRLVQGEFVAEVPGEEG